MKKIATLSFFLLILFVSKISAQESILSELNYAQLDKYISLAKENYTRGKITRLQMEIIKLDIPIAQVSYLDIFNASYFWRPDQNRDVLNPNNPYSVNGFQFGINVNLGNFLQKPFIVKRAKSNYKLAQLQNQDNQISIEMEVKRRYYAYLQAVSQLKIRTQTAQDNKNISETTRHKFERGEISLDNYNASRMLVSTSNSDRISYEVTYLNTKDALEEMIGQKLSDVK